MLYIDKKHIKTYWKAHYNKNNLLWEEKNSRCSQKAHNKVDKRIKFKAHQKAHQVSKIAEPKNQENAN